MKNKVIFFSLLVFVLFFNMILVNPTHIVVYPHTKNFGVESSPPHQLFLKVGVGVNAAEGEEIVQERPIDGERIVETIENAVRDFWEIVRLDRLFDIIIGFFRGIWDWAYTVFREGLERDRE